MPLRLIRRVEAVRRRPKLDETKLRCAVFDSNNRVPQLRKTVGDVHDHIII